MAGYNERPWLKSYDERVLADIEIPDDITYARLVDEAFRAFPDNIAYRFLGISHTYRMFDELTARFANYLRQMGVEKGETVGISLPNTPQYLIAHTGAIRAGCPVTGISPLLTAKEMAYQINDSGAKAVVVLDAIFEHRLSTVLKDTPNLAHIVATNITDFLPLHKRFLAKLLKKVPTGRIFQAEGKKVVAWRDMLARFEPEMERVGHKPEDICLIQYTGGTTGPPKGAELTQYNMAANALQTMNWIGVEKGKEVFCSAFPLFHQAGLILYMGSVYSGSTQLLIPDPRNTDHICDLIETFHPTGMANVPSLYQMLLENPRFKTLDLSSLKMAISGAAPFAAETIRAFEAVVGEGKAIEMYGMTETSPIMTANPILKPAKIGSVGLPISNTVVRLRNMETGEEDVPLGEEGEIVVKGPQVMKGYHNRPDETANTLRTIDGETWLFTGDVARMDEDGYIFIVDRAKDMLNVGGYKVFSREVEEKLYELPMIEFCAIVGIENEKRPGTDIVKLVVQLKTDFASHDPEALKEEILAYCKENMAPYKNPKIIQFVEAMPLTAVGKVDKKTLR